MAKKKKSKATAKPTARQPAIETTIAGAAKRIGVHPSTLKDWLAAGCPAKRGRYDVAAIAAWRSANRKPVEGSRADESSGRAKWELRKARAEALRKELDLQRERGTLIEVATATRVVTQHIATVKTHLEQLPDRIIGAVKLPAGEKKKLRDKVAGWIRDYCRAFQGSLRELAAANREAQQLSQREEH